jgi:diguanylate cyclase (GGDEF)-like protein
MIHLLNGIHTFFLTLHRNTISLIVLGFVALLGWLDYTTGFEISFSFFYLVPISIAAWYLDIKVGYFISLLSITTWLFSNQLAGEMYSHEVIRYWNAFLRLSLFLVISALVHQFKVVLQKERLLSRTDFLTGITNTREFYTQAELELKRASRYKHPLTMVYLDLDHFKQVNDWKGHKEGDRVLRTVAQTIAGSIRKTDTVARLGGDEFALLLPNTDQSAARTVIAKLERAVMQQMQAIQSPVTMSIGVVTFLSTPKSVDELLHWADERMYQAKTQGKNRTYYFQIE